MSRTRHIQNNFTSGEFDPILHDRYEYDQYKNGLATMQNFIPKPHGGAIRRVGTRYVATAKNSTASRLLPFIFSGEQANVLEVGEQYVRFFGENGQITDGGNPVEVTTVYGSLDVPGMYTAQDGDTLFIDHPSHPPRELVRLSSTEWQMRTSRHIPPPTREVGSEGIVELTLSATTGTAVTVTASGAHWLEGYIGRLITELPQYGSGQGVITGYTSATIVTMSVIDEFSSTTLAIDEWAMLGSPVVKLRMDKSQPVGEKVNLVLLGSPAGASNLVANGTFNTDLTSWTDSSAPNVMSSSATGGSDTDLVDDNVTFVTTGVAVGMRLVNTSDSTEDGILSVDSETRLTVTEDGATWSAGKNYDINKTGSAVVSSGRALLSGGPRGIAWIVQALTVQDGVYYRLQFDTSDAPLSMMIGTAGTLGDIVAEATYDIGNEHEVIFKAEGTTIYLSFRNNQPDVAGLDNVSVKVYELSGFNAADVGRYIRVNTGIIELTEFTNASRMAGVIRKELDTDEDALPGGWNLEDSYWTTGSYPSCVAFHGERLIHAASSNDPQRIWGSVPGQPKNFGSGANAADAVDFSLSATEINQLLWINGEKTLVAGTVREEFTIKGELGHTLTPTAIDATSPTKIGSKAIKPSRVPGSLLFVSRGGRRLYENTTAEDSTNDDRAVHDLQILAEHLTLNGIRSIAFQQEPYPILWIVTEADALLSMTYLKEQKVVAWSSHPTEGTVLDVCVIPHPDGDRDQVWLLVDRGGSAPYIEYMDDESGYYGQLMVDSGLTQTFSPATDSVTGLEHLEGQEVTVLVDGSVQTSKTVDNGHILLDYEGEEVEIGLPFTPTMTTLRPTIDNAPLIGLYMSPVRINLSLLNTLGVTVNGEYVDFATAADILGAPPALYTGLKEVTNVGWDAEGQITVTQTQPYPITVRAIAYTIEVESP